MHMNVFLIKNGTFKYYCFIQIFHTTSICLTFILSTWRLLVSKSLIGGQKWYTMHRAKWMVGIAFAFSLFICIPFCLELASAAVYSPTLALNESLFGSTEEWNTTLYETTNDVELGGNDSCFGATRNITYKHREPLPLVRQRFLSCYRLKSKLYTIKLSLIVTLNQNLFY